MAKSPKAKVLQDPEKPIATEIIAKSIVDLSAAAKKMLASGLTERAIIVLLQDHTKLGQTDIRTVLRALPELAATYTFFDGKKK